MKQYKSLKSPSKYVQGKNVLSNLVTHLDGYQQGLLVIISKSGEKRLGAECFESLRQHGFQVVIKHFEGESTRGVVDELVSIVKQENLSIVLGIGGGKILDTAKAVGHFAELPVAIVPTVASTDAPCSSLSILYHEDGTFDSYLFLKSCPDLILVDSDIIAKAPANLLVAGMGDAMATYFEARACKRSGKNNQLGAKPTLIATEMGSLCWKYLKEYGREAKMAVEENVCTPAVEAVIEVNTYLSGVGFESGGLAAAHAIQKGFTHIHELHDVYHGNKVAFCTLTQLVMESAPQEEINEVLDFCYDVGLPITFADMGYVDIDLQLIKKASEIACLPNATIHNLPFEVSEEDVFASLITANAIGTQYKKSKM